MTLKSGKRTILTTGAAQKLGDSVKINSIVVQAKYSNSTSIFIGGDGTQHIELMAGDSISFDGVDDISKIYIKGTKGEGVNYLIETL